MRGTQQMGVFQHPVKSSFDDVRRAVMNAIEEGIDSVVPACSLLHQTLVNNARAISETVVKCNQNKGFG